MKVSIVTAVYNGRDTIAASLESVARQDFDSIEHVVIDGVSNDGTLEVLDQHRSKIDVLISERDQGIYDALNKGLKLVSGDVVGFLHADDLLADETVISKICQEFRDPSVDAVYGDLVYVNRSDTTRIVRRWRAGEFSKRQLGLGWMPPHPTFYVRRRVYDRLGGFDTRYRISADYDCVLRLLGRSGINVAYLPKVIVKMRLGGISNRSIRDIVQKSKEDYMALRENDIGGLGALVWKNLRKLPQFL